MAGRSWKDLRRNNKPAPVAPAAAPLGQGEILARAGQGSAKLGQLLDQRKALEGRINSLVSGEGAQDPRDSARFNVPTFAQRQAQQREWEADREANAQRSLALRRQNRQQDQRDGGVAQPSETNQWLAQRGESQPQDGVSRWLKQRDQDRQSLRDRARDRLSPIDQVAGVGRQLRQPLNNMSSQLEQLDRQLSKEGLDSERDELKRLGADKLNKANQQLDKFSKMVEAPKKAVEKIDQQWQSRQNQISGAMDRFGPYVARARQRLSTETGGSGDLFERMSRNRERALTRRQERRQQEERDEARRKRALNHRRNKDDSRW